MIELNATLVAQIINFLILVIFLRLVAYKPIVKVLEARTNKIQGELQAAEDAVRDAEKNRQESQLLLQDARKQAETIISRADKQAEVNREEKVAATAREIAQMKETAKADIEKDRLDAVEALRAEMITLSMAAASKIIAKNMDQKQNEALITEFINQLDGKVGDLRC